MKTLLLLALALPSLACADIAVSARDFTTAITKERTIEIALRSTDARAQSVVCRVFWIGTLVDGSARRIIGEDASKYAVASAQPAVFECMSPRVFIPDNIVQNPHPRVPAAEHVEGWAVLIEEPATGKLLSAKCSSPQLDSLLRKGDLEWLPRRADAPTLPKPFDSAPKVADDARPHMQPKPRVLPASNPG